MYKQFTLITSFLFLVTGCATTTFSPVAGLEKENLSSRSVPAKISKESSKVLEKKGYASIGSVRSEYEAKTCWDDDCVNFTCTPEVQQKDTMQEVLEKAASQGGDLVILQKESAPFTESITRRGKCIGGKLMDHQVQESYQPCSGCPVQYRWVWKQHWECTSWGTSYGKKCGFVSTGTVWRHDPEMTKRLAEFSREQKEKSKIEAVKKFKEEKEKQKKEKEAEKINAQFATLQKAYRESPLPEKDKLVSVKVDGKYGFKDTRGRMIIEPQFTDTIGFAEGLAPVSTGRKDETINNLTVTVGKEWGYIDKTGKWVIRPSYEYAGIFSEGLANARVNKKYGYINKAGQFVIKPQFRNAFVFSEGLAVIISEDNLKYGYIDKKGNFIIKPQFDHAYRFVNGIAEVKVDGKRKIIDKSGKTIVEEP